MSNPTNLSADDFVERYLGEYDRHFVSASIPVDPNFVRAVEEAITFLGAWAASKPLDAIYDRIKARVMKRLQSQPKKTTDIAILPHPASTGPFILEFGNVRPAFHIQEGSRLLLKGVTVRFVGPPLGLIIEDMAPSFLPEKVRFIEARKRNLGVGRFQIYSPIWVGKGDENPYDQRSRGGPVMIWDMTDKEAKAKGITNYILKGVR